MANGTISLVRTGSGYLTGQILWSSTSNGTAENTSTVTAELQLQRSALNTTTGTFKGTFTVGSTSETISWYGSLPSMEWVTVKTLTVTVNHNANGDGTCYLYALINGPTGTTMEGTSVSGASTVTLDWIPRYATITAVTDFTDEEDPVITYSNPAGTAVEELQAWFSLDGTSVFTNRTIPLTATSYTFALTDSERNALRKAAANQSALTLSFYVRTVISGSVFNIGTKATMRIVNAKPTVAPVIVDTNSATVAVTGNSAILVAQQSVASVAINAAAQKYATIVSRRVEHGAAVLTEDGTLSPVTNHPIKISVTDSRGNVTTQYADNTIVPYISPTCLIGNNIPLADGSFTLEASGLFYNGSIGATANTLTVQYRYKASGGSYGSWTSMETVNKSGNSYSATTALTGLDYQTAYVFQARAIDALYSSGVTSGEKTVIAEPVFSWGKDRFLFNVPVDLKSNCDIYKNGKVAYFKAYGTRNSSSSQNDFDALTELGGYWIQGKGMSNGPIDSATSYYGFLEVIYVSAGILQRFTRYGTNGIVSVYQRDNINGWKYNWTRIDSVPEEMNYGIAYLTKEKWNGKQVYAKVIDLGAMQSGGLKHHNTGVWYGENPTFIGLAVYVTNGTFVYDLMSNSWSAGTAYLWTNGNLWYVNVTCASDMSAWTGKAKIKWVY